MSEAKKKFAPGAETFRWSAFLASGVPPERQLSDNRWEALKDAAGGLPDEARHKLDILITQSSAEREEELAIPVADESRAQLQKLRACEVARGGALDTALGNLALAQEFGCLRELKERHLQDVRELDRIIARANAALNSTRTGPRTDTEHLFAARIQDVLARYGKEMRTTKNKPAPGKRAHWPTFLKIMMQEAGFAVTEARLTTLIRGIVQTRSGRSRNAGKSVG